MKNIEKWEATKFSIVKENLRASRDSKLLYPGSRIMTDSIAYAYQSIGSKFISGRLLDLGCGNAPLYGFYKDKVESVTCVDWSNSPHEAIHLDQICDLNKKLPYPDCSFDCIILSDVLEHIYNPTLLLSEISRLLSKDGILIANTPFYYWLHEEPYDYFRYTKFALDRMVKESGMDIVCLDELGGIMEVFGDLAGKLCAKIPLIGTPISISIAWAVVALSRTTIGIKIKQTSSKKFPLGYFFIAKKRRYLS